MIADPNRKPHQDNGDSGRRRRQEEELDEALKNTFRRPIRFQSSSLRRPPPTDDASAYALVSSLSRATRASTCARTSAAPPTLWTEF
jgi:hypothetical protein